VDVIRQLVTMTLTVCVEQRDLVTLNDCAKTRQQGRPAATCRVATETRLDDNKRLREDALWPSLLWP